MNKLRFTAISTLLTLGLASVAAAQDIDPEAGGVWVPPPDDTQSPPPQQQQQPPQQQPWYQGGPTGQQAQAETPPPVDTTSPPPAASSAAEPSDGQSDHARHAVGHVGVGFMGLLGVPTVNRMGEIGTLSAPTLGARIWISELVGVDLGFGLSFSGGSVSSGSMSAPSDNAFAFAFHAGVPLAIFHAEHYKFLIIPELNIGGVGGTFFGASSDQDQGRNGFLFQIGGRVGAEIHFGFIDVPQLSLQAGVGLYFDYRSVGIGESRAGAPASSLDVWGFGTSVQGEPWDIFLGSLTALYYF